MDPLTYLHLQLRLEGKELVNGHFLRQVEALPGEEMPLMLLAQLANKELITYYAEALSPDLQNELAENLFEIVFPNVDHFLNVLQSYQLEYEVGHYKTYVFPSQTSKDRDVICLSKHDPRVKAFGFDGFAQNVYAMERDGKLVSACVSTRENDRCGEAWVYTDVQYRNQGFAQKVVNAWAASLMDEGKVPFYSHKIENEASANLAGKLGLHPVYEEIVLIQI
jgi:RimJ/RimL family protein N-acetyltransferase